MKTYKQFEALRWYKGGKFTEDPNFKDEIKDYDDFITDEEFKQFLIDNNVYDEFIKYVHPDFKNNFKEHYFYRRSSYIDDAISWHSTPNPVMWRKLNKVWYDIAY